MSIPSFCPELDAVAVGPVNVTAQWEEVERFAGCVTGEKDRFGALCVTVWVLFEDDDEPVPMLGCRIDMGGEVAFFHDEDMWAVKDETLTIDELDLDLHMTAAEALAEALPYLATRLQIAPFGLDAFSEDYLEAHGGASAATTLETIFVGLSEPEFLPPPDLLG